MRRKPNPNWHGHYLYYRGDCEEVADYSRGRIGGDLAARFSASPKWIDSHQVLNRYGPVFAGNLRGLVYKALSGAGRLLRCKPERQRLGKWLYHAGDCEKIAAYRNRIGGDTLPPEDFADADGTWLRDDIAEQRHGLRRDSLYRWHANGCPWIDGRKLRLRKKARTVSRMKRLFHRSYYLETELLEIIKAMHAAAGRQPRAEPILDFQGNGWVPSDKVEAVCGRSLGTLRFWARRGCPYLEGKKPRSELERLGAFQA